MDVPNSRFPFITCYARILDRITLNPVTEFIDTLNNDQIWDLGVIYKQGGYSQYIIEFDIWNNEPVVSNGLTQVYYDNAENCNVSIWKDEEMKHYFPYKLIQIRNSTLDNSSTFENIIEHDRFYNIYGNVNSTNMQTLNGLGDHTKFQIGIELPNLDYLSADVTQDFVVCFEYFAQNLTIDLFFKCKFNVTTELFTPEVNHIGKLIPSVTGKISMPPVYLPNGDNKILVEAYDLNNKLKDQCVTTNYTYHLYIPSGVYNFIIKNNLNTRNFNNMSVNGIEFYYNYIDKGLISKIYGDVIEYYSLMSHEEVEQYYKSNKIDLNSHKYTNCDTAFNHHDHNIKQIFGYMKDEYNIPIQDAEIIIIHDDELVVYCKTNELGQYKFCLKNGLYDIRIRCKDKKVKILRNFFFDNNKGFFTEIKKLSGDFNNEINFACDY
jgi:hypothetical protein